MSEKVLDKFIVPNELSEILSDGKKIFTPNSRLELLHVVMGSSNETNIFEVAYELPGKGKVVEATVTRCKNGFSVNYPDPYMRRRDPQAMLVADDKPTDKERFVDRYGKPFNDLRQETLEWLKNQDELIVMAYMAGGKEHGYPSLLIAPINTGFFAAGLADLQKFVPFNELPADYQPESVIYVAPPFRHTHLDGKQVVVHNRKDDFHEIFSYNLYPGPSAKKGVYGILINKGESDGEGWPTLHASSVKVETEDNTFVIMHEGASGGGKSEMLEQIHRDNDGKMLFAKNLVTDEEIKLDMNDTCKLNPVTDDIALCPPKVKSKDKKLVVTDAEDGWFLRVDHISEYGTEPHLEELTIHPKEPLIFLNIDGKVDSTALIWEHIYDTPDKVCTNPRVIVPRKFVENIVQEPVEVDVRTFGVRTPPSFKDKPNYGVVGVMHVLPPALAWLWRLVSPRGFGNPSITATEGMKSEGVGSYWPFATGKRVTQANILLKQILETPNTRYKLIPNQHIGAYKVGFAAEWITREYVAKNGVSNLTEDYITPAKCPLLGYTLNSLSIDGYDFPIGFLQVDKQPEVGEKAYDAGASMLVDFFKQEVQKYLTDDLDPLGREIIETFLNDGTVEDYEKLIPRT